MSSFYSILAILVLLSFAYNAYAVDIITTVAGTGNGGFSGDNGPATSADLLDPRGVHVDAAGNIYIADSNNCRVRKVGANGVVTTIAGTNNCLISNYNGDNMAATSASLSYPRSVTSDTLGNIYIADTSNNRVRKVNVNGVITTIAGSGNYGFNGDNIAATTADLGYPYSISLCKAGNLYICDQNNHRIRKVDVNGIITTVAGTGMGGYYGDNILATAANLYFPSGVSTDSSGNIYINDGANYRIRKVDVNGIIFTIAGTGISGFSGDGGLAINANIAAYGMTPDAFGNLYIADNFNQRVRKVDVYGIITTVAGTGTMGYNGDNIDATMATLSYPLSVTTESSGNLYIADSNNHRIRKVTFPDRPTAKPTSKPTKKAPSFRPTNKPTKKKTAAPSRRPTKKPTKKPTK